MLEENSFLFIITTISIIFSSLISFSEASILSANKNKVLLKKNSKFLRFAIHILEKKDQVITLVLILNTFGNVITSVCITTLATKFFHSGVLIIASIISTILLLLFGEIFPKILAMKDPNKFLLIVSPAVYLLLKIFYPIVFLVELLLKFIFFIFRLKNLNQTTKFSKEIKELVEVYKITFKKSLSNNDSQIKKEHKIEMKYIKMINAISNLEEFTIEQIMTHRVKVFHIDIDDDYEKIKKQICESNHSRILVCEKEIDNIIGILNKKDILRFCNFNEDLSKEKIREILQKPIFVFENTPLLTQLENFKNEKKHFAVVVDEYSVMVGIITLSDILEEIIGTIYDEYDVHKQDIKKINEKEFIINASLPIHEFIQELGVEIENYEDYTTLGAFLIDEFGYIPEKNEEITIKNLYFKILSIENHKINKAINKVYFYILDE